MCSRKAWFSYGEEMKEVFRGEIKQRNVSGDQLSFWCRKGLSGGGDQLVRKDNVMCCVEISIP